METLAVQPRQPDTGFDQDKRDYHDLTTQFAEMLDGSMRTPFEYQFDGQELIAEDGSIMRLEFEKGLESADQTADKRPNLAFEVRRRRSEIDEHYDMIKMARGQLPNTMVVVSDFPAELKDSPVPVGGYDPRRKLAMLRVLAWDGQTIRMYSQSLDRSDRRALEAIYQDLGCDPCDDELLGQRIHLQLSEAEQAFLTDKLTAVYDHRLTDLYGGQWSAGRRDINRLNTYDFVREQHDIVQFALRQKKLGKLAVYQVAASLQERFERNVAIEPQRIIARDTGLFANLQVEMWQAAGRAQRIGKVFSACGMSIGASGPSGVTEQLTEAGYGNKSDESTSYSFSKRMYCVVCQAPPSKEDVAKKNMKLCGPCGICKGCDKKLSK